MFWRYKDLIVFVLSLSELDDVHNIINWGEIEQTLSNTKLCQGLLVELILRYILVSRFTSAGYLEVYHGF